MARDSNTPQRGKAQPFKCSPPVYRYDEALAALAYQAHQALVQAEANDPRLTGNPVWQTLRMDAYEAFHNAFGGAAMIENIEAEASLIGALLIENRLVDPTADLLDASDFFEPLHQRIYSTILAEMAKGNTVNAATLKPYFDNDAALDELGGIGYLMQLTASGDGLFAPRELAEQIRELAARRKMQAGLDTASQACADITVPVSEILEHADAALTANAKDTLHQPTGGQCIDELLRAYEDKASGVECGAIASLDSLLGPMRPKQLIIGAGRPGMGKTALAISYGLGAAQRGHGVLFVSLEMSSTELAARMASDLCFGVDRAIPFSAIRDGTLDPGQHEMVRKAGTHLHGLPFQVIDAGSLTTGRLAMLVRRHARKMAARGEKLELVIVDYLQLLSSDTKGRSNYETVSEVSRSLKALAKDADLAVLALAQLSREVEKRPDRRPQLSDLRDSGQIEQDADAVLFLMRAEYYLRQDEPDQMSPKRAEWQHALAEAQGKIEFILAKRRNGTTGTAMGEFHGGYQAVRG